MSPKPAKAMLMALALGKPKAGASHPDEEGEGDMDMGGGAKKAAARDLIAAVKSGDADAVDQALTDHYDACAAGESAEETEGESSEED